MSAPSDFVRAVYDQRTNSAILDLKAQAEAGGEFGPYFDQGVLSVLGQIESAGSYAADPIRIADAVYQADAAGMAGMVTAEERERAERLALEKGWSLQACAEFARGVMHAESRLAAYGVRPSAGIESWPAR